MHSVQSAWHGHIPPDGAGSGRMTPNLTHHVLADGAT